MLIAEDLLLLLTDDGTGKLRIPAIQVDFALAGANLIELTLMNKVELAWDGRQGKGGRVVVRDAASTGDDVLDAALETLVAHGRRKPQAAVKKLAKNARERLYERLAASGALRSERARMLGLFPRHTWPAVDAHHEAEVRRSITEALVRGAPPDAHTAALIALLHALRCEQKVVDFRQYGMSKADLRARAAEIATGNWAAEAVRKTINAMLAAAVAASAAAGSTVVLPGAR
jgi:hypothetical protein